VSGLELACNRCIRERLLTDEELPMNACVISFDHPSTIKHNATTTDPPTMNGRRLPHLLFDLSASAPTRGAMMMPDRGLQALALILLCVSAVFSGGCLHVPRDPY
jgi:hypothetical protein